MNATDANTVKFLVVQSQNHVNLDRQTTAKVRCSWSFKVTDVSTNR